MEGFQLYRKLVHRVEMNFLLKISKKIDHIQGGLGKFCAGLIFVMTILGALNAILRYVGKYIGMTLTSNALLEAQWYIFGATFLLAAPWTLLHNRHVRVDILYGQLKKRGQVWIDLIGTLIFLIPFCLYGIYASKDFVLTSWEIGEWSSDAGGLPRYPIKSLIPLGFLLLFLQGLSSLIKNIAFLRDKPCSEEVNGG